jgi:hypothetical protein
VAELAVFCGRCVRFRIGDDDVLLKLGIGVMCD